MVNFELGEEIEKYVSSSFHEGQFTNIYFFTELKINHVSYSICKHAIDSADPRSMQDVSYMNFVIVLLTIESLWLSGRASERGIRRSEVRFLKGNFLFDPRI